MPTKSLIKPSLPKNKSIFTKIIFILLIPFIVSSCAPDYPKEKVIETIEKSVADYGLEGKAEQINRTVYVLCQGENLFQITSLGGINFDAENAQKLNEMVFSVTKVLYNSDIDIDFYVIKIAEKTTGIEGTLIGSINDLKKSWLGVYPPGDLFLRRIFYLKQPSEKETSPLKESKEVKWPNFLIEQIKKRVMVEFPTKVDITGDFVEGERFLFIVAPVQKNPAIIPYTIETIARVFESYEFEDFNTVTLLDIYTGKIRIINKEDLKKYR